MSKQNSYITRACSEEKTLQPLLQSEKFSPASTNPQTSVRVRLGWLLPSLSRNCNWWLFVFVCWTISLVRWQREKKRGRKKKTEFKCERLEMGPWQRHQVFPVFHEMTKLSLMSVTVNPRRNEVPLLSTNLWSVIFVVDNFATYNNVHILYPVLWLFFNNNYTETTKSIWQRTFKQQKTIVMSRTCRILV